MMSFIQALFDETVPLPTELEEYVQVLKDIEYFGIGPQIYTLLKQRNRFEKTPPSFQERLKALYKESLPRNLFIKFETERLLNRFEAEGIPVIPLKGTIFAQTYFDDFAARQTTDIDLLIHPRDISRAVACVQSLGFVLQGEPIPEHFHISFAKALPNSSLPLPVELHWSILTDNTSSLNPQDLWRDAVPYASYKYVMMLSELKTFYMISLHGWKHALDSLKYFIDIIQLIHVIGDLLDLNKLFEMTKEHKTTKRMRSTLSIVYYHFPHLQTIKPFLERKKRRLWWDYDSIRYKDKNRNPLKYIRFIQYQWLDFDTPLQCIIATSQYIKSLQRGHSSENIQI